MCGPHTFMMDKWNNAVGTNELTLHRDQEKHDLQNFNRGALQPEQAPTDAWGFHAPADY